jgi:hypothetical protein
MMHLRHDRPKDEGFRRHQALPAEQREEIVKKGTPKSLSVPWTPYKPEAGNFSEFKGLGGMMGFDAPSETSTLAFMIVFAGGQYYFFSSVHAHGCWPFAPSVNGLSHRLSRKGRMSVSPGKDSGFAPTPPKSHVHPG